MDPARPGALSRKPVAWPRTRGTVAFRRLQPHVLIEVTDGAIANAAPLSKLVAENGNKIKGLRPECEVYAAPADQPGPAIAEKLNGLILSKFPN